MGIYLFTPEDLMRYGSARPEQLEVLREAILGKKDILIVGSSRSGKTKLVEALIHYIPNDWKVAVVTSYSEFKPFKPNVLVIDTQFDQRPLGVRTAEVIEKLRRIKPDYVVIDALHTVDSARIFRELIDEYAFIVTSLAMNEDIRSEVKHWLRLDEETFKKFDVVVLLKRDFRTGKKMIDRIYRVVDGSLVEVV